MNRFKDIILQRLNEHKLEILEQIPNLKPEDYHSLLHLIIGHDLGKEGYVGLEFSLEDDRYLEELRNLSNGYLEFTNGVVKMGVTNLENLEKILKVPYIKSKTVCIL